MGFPGTPGILGTLTVAIYRINFYFFLTLKLKLINFYKINFKFNKYLNKSVIYLIILFLLHTKNNDSLDFTNKLHKLYF